MKKYLFPIVFQLFFLLYLQPLFGQYPVPQERFGNPNRYVHDSYVKDSIAYVCGDFRWIGEPSGTAILLSVDSAKFDRGFPKVCGRVDVIISDGLGGWYLGGMITHIGGYETKNIAHVFADLTVDTLFNRNAGQNTRIYQLALGKKHLYVLRDEYICGNYALNSFLRIDRTTGIADSWVFPISPLARVYSFLVAGDFLHVTGDFTSVAGQPRTGFAQLIDTSGVLTNLNINFSPPTPGGMLLHGQELFISGGFNTVNGQTSRKLVRVNYLSGNIHRSNIDFLAGNNGSMCILNDKLYVSGTFTSVQVGIPSGPIYNRNHTACFNLNLNTIYPWNPNFTFSAGIIPADDGIIFTDGMAGALFEKAPFCAKVDTLLGSLDTTWIPGLTDRVFNAVRVGNQIMLGGDFTSAEAVFRRQLAAYNLNTGKLTAWAPTAGIPMNAVPIRSISGIDTTIYISHTNIPINGVTRLGVSALSLRTGALIPGWQPNVDMEAYAMLPDSHSLYIGGVFNQINGATRQYAGNIRIPSDSVGIWNPRPQNHIYSMDRKDSIIALAGRFTGLGSGLPSEALAIVNDSNGAYYPIDFNLNGTAYDVAIFDSIIVAVGSFVYSSPYGQRGGFAAFNVNTGALLNIYPRARINCFPNYTYTGMNSVEIIDSLIVFSGNFDTIDGQPRADIAVYNWQLNKLSPFRLDNDGAVECIENYENVLVIGGYLKRIHASPNSGVLFCLKNSVDAGITDFSQPGSNFCLGPQKLKIKLKNYGMQPLTNCPIVIQLNGVLVDTVQWSGNLASGEETPFFELYEYPTQANGQYAFNIWTDLANDPVYFNDSITFKYIPKNLGWTDLMVGDSVACAGSISDFGIRGALGARYSWQSSSGSIIGSDSAKGIKILWPDSAINQAAVSLFVESPGGRCKDTLGFYVQIHKPNPILSIHSDTTICKGDSFNLSLNYQSGIYDWNGAGIMSSSISVGDSGKYWVEYTDTLGCSNNSDSLSVYYHPGFIPTIYPSIDTFFCAGDSVLFSVANWPIGFWNGMGTPSSSHWVDTQSTVWIEVTDVNGCQVHSDTILVQEKALPSPVIIRSPDTIACQGDTIHFFTGPFSNIVWSNGSGTSGISITAPGDFWVDVTDSIGCQSRSDTLSAYFRALPIPLLSLSQDTSICRGDSFLLSINYQSGNFDWNGLGIFTNSITISDSGAYWVAYADSFGCSNKSDTISVQMYPEFFPSIFPYNDTVFCTGDSVFFSITNWPTGIWNGNGMPTFSNWVKSQGPVWLETTDANGCEAKSDTIFVQELPLPTPIIISFPGTTACQGDTIHLMTANYPGILWSNGSTDSLIKITITDDFWVDVTDNFGCLNRSDTLSTLIYSNPQPILSVSQDTFLCKGDSIPLMINYQVGSFNWNGIGIFTSSISVSDTGIYWVEYIDTFGCSNSSDTLLVSFYPDFLPILSPSVDTAICSGDSILFSIMNWPIGIWNGMGLPSSNRWVNAQGPVWIELIDSNGCKALSDTIYLQELSLPNPIISSFPDTTACQGDTIILSTGNFNNVLWSNGYTSTSTNVLSSGDYWVAVLDSFGCEGHSDTTHVRIFPRITPVILPTYDTLICAGDSILFTIANFSSGYWNGQGLATPSHWVDSPGFVWLESLDSNGCATTSDSIFVNQVPIPQPILFPNGPIVFCVGDSVSIQVGSYPSVFWPNQGDSGMSVWINNSQTIWAIVTDTNGCSNNSDTLTTLMNPLPIVQFSSTINGMDVFFAQNISSNAASWAWNFGDGNTSSQSNPTHTYLSSGAYYPCLVVVDSNGCQNEFCDTITLISTDLEPAWGIRKRLFAFPNPSSGEVNIQVPASNPGEWGLILYNEVGIIQFELKDWMDLSNPQKMDFGRLPSGIYYLRATKDAISYSTKITIQQ